MSRNDTPPSASHTHFLPAGELAGSWLEGKEAESAGPGYLRGERHDTFAGNWEAAWIDLGGEG